jgi:hypothetical protein
MNSLCRHTTSAALHTARYCATACTTVCMRCGTRARSSGVRMHMRPAASQSHRYCTTKSPPNLFHPGVPELQQPLLHQAQLRLQLLRLSCWP